MKRTALQLAIVLCTLLNLGCAATRLRSSLSVGPLLEPAQPSAPVEVLHDDSQVGSASYYHPDFVGRKTASGERYSDRLLTAAHRTLDLGTLVRVTNLDNLKSVVVRVNDRGPYVQGRIIDLSRRAARILGFVHDGVARVRVDPLT